MGISIVQPPPKRAGRKARLSDEDIRDLATALKGGNAASDGEPTIKRAAAYQRALTAQQRVRAEHNIESTRRVWAVNPDDPNTTWMWALEPKA